MMISSKNTTAWAEVNKQGDLVIPHAVAARFGLIPGARVRLDEDLNALRLHRPVTQLTKVYIEPTVACNLDCITCFRHGWNEINGRMSEATFEAIVAGLQTFDPMPSVYFGGIGEPLFHPRTLDWVARVKALGVKVELITNGTILTEKASRQLIEAGLDILWVSLDGATPEAYADVRLGAELPHVLENLRRFNRLRPPGHHTRPELGVAFVAMKRNIAQLPHVIELGKPLRVKHYSVSNLQPASEAMQAEQLYNRSLRNIAYMNARSAPTLSLPKMDFDETTRDALLAAFNSGCNVRFAGNSWSGANDVCNFVEAGSLSITWRGEVAPCWPLMHAHNTFMHHKPHHKHAHHIGNVRDIPLRDLWLDEAYVAYRERLHNFGFAPCSFCGGCDLSEENLTDCFNSPAPACGTCLWAQGIVQCP